MSQTIESTDIFTELLELDGKNAISLAEYRRRTEAVPFELMTAIFTAGVDARIERGDHLYRRAATALSADGAEVTVIDPLTNEPRRMLNFASNSYLGLGKHPKVIAAIAEALATYGTGPAGSPMLNGTTELHLKLERRLARWLGKEAAMLFSSGYLANGWPAVLVRPGDLFVWDERLHASLQMGAMKALATMRGMGNIDERVVTHVFHHNDTRQLRNIVRRFRKAGGYQSQGPRFMPPRESVWIAVEGVYSMDGDLARLPEIAKIAEEYAAFLVVDDAHGEGILGRGRGIEHHFTAPATTFLTVGTLGKAFASGGGGFIAGPRGVIEYLRVHAPTYLYSTSLSTANTAAALAAIEIIECEPWRVDVLHKNVSYLVRGLREIGLEIEDRDSGIIGLTVPVRTDLRKLAMKIHSRDIDIATVEPPVVPHNDQHIRINVSAAHTQEQMDRFLAVLREFADELVWTPDDVARFKGEELPLERDSPPGQTGLIHS
jgi:glycine C-acetyltransferase